MAIEHDDLKPLLTELGHSLNSFNDAIKQLAPNFNHVLNQAGGGLGTIVSRLAELSIGASILQATMGGTTQSLSHMGVALKDTAGFFKDITTRGLFKELLDGDMNAHRNVFGGEETDEHGNVTKVTGFLPDLLGKLTASGEGAEAAGAAGAATGGLVALAFAAGLATKAFMSIMEDSKKWVELLSPGTIFVFDQEMRNLGATLGQGFIPAWEMFIENIRNVGDLLDPMMTALEPFISQVAADLGSLGELIAKFVVSNTPSIEAAIVAFDLFVRYLQMATVALEWLTMLSPLGLLNMFGSAPSGPGQRAAAAPLNVSIGNVESIARHMTEAAFKSGSGRTFESNVISRMDSILQAMRPRSAAQGAPGQIARGVFAFTLDQARRQILPWWGD